jgi:hypothetical protein
VQILNAHMASLQWIDETTTTLRARLDKVARERQTARADAERQRRLG